MIAGKVTQTRINEKFESMLAVGVDEVCTLKQYIQCDKMFREIVFRFETFVLTHFYTCNFQMSWDDLAETSYGMTGYIVKILHICGGFIVFFCFPCFASRHSDWPSIADLTAYRMQVRILVDRFIRCTKLNVPIGWDSPYVRKDGGGDVGDIS